MNDFPMQTCTTIRSNREWQQAMVAYADRCIEFSLTEEDTWQADAAEQAMSEAFGKVAEIIDRFCS